MAATGGRGKEAAAKRTAANKAPAYDYKQEARLLAKEKALKARKKAIESAIDEGFGGPRNAEMFEYLEGLDLEYEVVKEKLREVRKKLKSLKGG